MYVSSIDPAEYPNPSWEINETMLLRFPVLNELLHLATFLGVENGTRQIGKGYFDRGDARDLCAYEMEMIWKWPDGDNGTKHAPHAWHHNERIYRFNFHDFRNDW